MRSRYFPEFDLLRGLAVTMMIVNHFGLGLLSKAAVASELGNGLVQFGSFAPVLFFFITGIMAGLQRERAGQFTRVVLKAIILLACDVVLTLAARGSIGFDFLAFIGLSTLVGYFLARSQHGLILSAVGFCMFVGLRFVVGNYLRAHVSVEVLRQISVVLGVYSVYGLGYPLGPWLCFPFLGFSLSPVIQDSPCAEGWTRRNAAFLVVGGVLLGASLFAVSRGAAFARYTTVSAAYFVAALGVAFVSLTICREAAHGRSLPVRSIAPWFGTRGVACLSVVPIHYLLLELLQRLGFGNLLPGQFILLLAIVIPTCLFLGRSFEVIARKLISEVSMRTVVLISAILVIASLVVCCESQESLPRMCGMFLGQIMLCLLLVGIDDWLSPKEVDDAGSGGNVAANIATVARD